MLGASIAIGTAVSEGQGTDAVQPRGMPDLAMHKILDIKVHPLYTRRGKVIKHRWGLRFTSIVDNVGTGPFVINAHRAHVGQPCPPDDNGVHRCEKGDMTADQLVLLPDGTSRTYRAVAKVWFDPNHFHWHLRGANRYELRTADGRRRLTRDSKTGFCFGDRITNTTPAAPHYPGLGDGLSTCLYGSQDPAVDGRRALSLTEGISAGYGDDYRSFHNGAPLEGQQLELTRLKAGRYLLVNTTNATGRYHEVTRANNASSALVRLSWPHGRRHKPAIKVIANCPGKPRCRATKAPR
jgi:hypothetical protein